MKEFLFATITLLAATAALAEGDIFVSALQYPPTNQAIQKDIGAIWTKREDRGRQSVEPHDGQQRRAARDCVADLTNYAKQQGANALLGLQFTYTTSFSEGYEQFGIVCWAEAVVLKR